MIAKRSGRGSLRKREKGEAFTISVLPMAVEVGDRITDEEGEWEVIARPSTFREGHSVHARVQRLGDSTTEKDITWPAHEKVTVRRAQ